MRKLLVSARLPGNLELVSFTHLLPILAVPWPAMGDFEILTRIGNALDHMPMDGTGDAQWSGAQLISTIHKEYAQRGGIYQRVYPSNPPGTLLVGPVHNGKQNMWGLEAELRDGFSAARITMYAGPKESSSDKRITVCCEHEVMTYLAEKLSEVKIKYDHYLANI